MSSKKPKSDGDVGASTDKAAHPLVITARKQDVWNGLLLLRIANALTLATYFQPDEFYQALEPAWHLAFGAGQAEWQGGAYTGPWMTWEWIHGLRSSLYPVLYSGVYKAIDKVAVALFSPVLQTKLLLYGPKLVQGVGAALMDYYTWALAGRVYGDSSLESSAVLALAATSPWQFYVSTRSMSNCLETTLTVMALYFWPWESLKTTPSRAGLSSDSSNLKYSLILAALASILRPTNLLIWITLSLSIVFSNRRTLLTLISSGFVWGSMVLLLSLLSDLFFYGRITLPAWNFYKYNIKQGLSAYYGENRIDYYFTEGIPFLLTLALPFAVTGLSQALTGRYLALPADTRGGVIQPRILRCMALAVLSLPLALTFVGHKEARFIYPILPMLLIIIARPVIGFFHPFPKPTSGARKALLTAFFAGNILLSIYLGYFHNRDAIGAIDFLRSEHERHNPGLVNHGQIKDVNVTTAGIFAPCHSTPWRSQLLYSELHVFALTCEPPIHMSDEEREKYEDEADDFFNDPETWIKREFATQRRTWPSYVAMYDNLVPIFKGLVTQNTYEEAWRGSGALFYEDWRKQGPIVVFAKTLAYGGPGRKHNPLPADAPDPDMDTLTEALSGDEQTAQKMGFDSKKAADQIADKKMGRDRAEK